MHILVTRPEADATRLSSELQALGYAVTEAPLLEIALEPPASLGLDGVAGIIATSRNGLRGLAAAPPEVLAAATAVRLVAVGSATADYARQLGFTRIVAGPGTARELGTLIPAEFTPGAGRLIYLTGDKLAFDLAAALAPAGFEVERLQVYRSKGVETLTPAVLQSLKIGAIGAVILMSPLAARTWCAIAKREEILEQVQQVVYICLSQNVAAELVRIGAPHTLAARQPRIEDVLALAQQLASG